MVLSRCLPDSDFCDFAEVKGLGHESEGCGPEIALKMGLSPGEDAEPKGDGLRGELQDEHLRLMSEPEEEHGIGRMGFEIGPPQVLWDRAEVLHQTAMHGMTQEGPRLELPALPEQGGGVSVLTTLLELLFKLEIDGRIEVGHVRRGRWCRWGVEGWGGLHEMGRQ